MAWSQITRIYLTSFAPQKILQALTDVDFTGIDLVGTVNGAHSAGDATIDIASFSTNMPTGCVIIFDGHDQPYYVSTGGSSTAITISPPLKEALANGEAVEIYPHFLIDAETISISDLERESLFNAFNLILERQIDVSVQNFTEAFYDVLTHSTSWSLGGSHFSTYFDTDSKALKYIRIDIKRNSTWYAAYDGEIDHKYLSVNVEEKTIDFKVRGCIYQLQDKQVQEVTGCYNLHAYTSTSAPTKTVSGKYYDIIKELFHAIGIQKTSYSVTNEELTSSGLATITIGSGHTVQVGELITYSGGNALINGTWRVASKAATTISFYVKSKPLADSQTENNAGYSIGATSITLSAAFPTFSGTGGNDRHKCRFSNHDYLYQFSLSGTTLTITPGLQSALTAGGSADTVYIGYQPTVASGAASGTLVQHRVYFDDFDELFAVTRYNWDYDFSDCMFITQKWRSADVGESLCSELLADFCRLFNAFISTTYINGACYGVFRSHGNQSTSKGAINEVDIFNVKPMKPNWDEYSTDGVIVSGQVNYFDGDQVEDAYRYHPTTGHRYTFGLSEKGSESFATRDTAFETGDLVSLAGGIYRVKEVIPAVSSKTISSFTRTADSNVVVVTTSTAHGFTKGQIIEITGTSTEIDDTWEITRIVSTTVFRFKSESVGVLSGSGSVTGETTHIVNPPLDESIKTNTAVFVENDVPPVNVKFLDCFNLKVRFPDLYVSDDSAIYQLYNYGPSIAHYGTTTINNSSTEDYGGVCVVPLIPIEYKSEIPTGDAIICPDAAASGGFPDGVGRLRHWPRFTNSILSRFRIADSDGNVHTSTNDWRFVTCGYVDQYNEVTDTTQMTLAVFFGHGTTDTIYRATLKMNDVETSEQFKIKKKIIKFYRGMDIDRYLTFIMPQLYDFEKGRAYKNTRKKKFVTSVTESRIDFGNSALVTNETATQINDNPKIQTIAVNLGGLHLFSDVLSPYYDDRFYLIVPISSVATLCAQEFSNSEKTSGATQFDFTLAMPATATDTWKGMHIKLNGRLYAYNQNTDIVYRTGQVMPYSSWSTHIGGGGTSPALLASATGGNLSLNNACYLWTAYDNYLAVCDRGNNKIILYDQDNDAAWCVKDSLSNPNSVFGVDFTQWFRNDNGSVIHTVGATYYTSKQMHEHFAVRRREKTFSIQDADIESYILGDRFTLDDDIMSSTTTGTKAWIRTERFNWETHNHTINWLESEAA